MISSLIKFSIHNKVIIAAMILALIGWGGYSLQHLPLDAIPDITNNQVNIVTIAPNLAPVEMEQFVTYPVEIAMANIQGLENVRSVSQFGLSIVTLDFKDGIDNYWARNQATERLGQVTKDIPMGFGRPELLPLTTGLGEVFQYSIDPIDPKDTSYSLTELRTIQDWIVKRQLLGTEGVAEISSFGGNTKQYQIRINPEKLKATGITMPEVFKAVEAGNANTGAAYIEKNTNLYFIRGIGIAQTVKDLENTFVKNTGSNPVLVKDLASVEIGSAIRFGTMVKNERETAGGIVLMLKGENSRTVIENVKQRLKQIEPELPKGLKITPFLDRELLINRTITTVSHNLLEGGLIVVFVLVLLLGHLRAGLIVASVIPLSMLFAISMMVLFKVSGNLMSLGAIDFGLIVDGAVIIVENIVRRLTQQPTTAVADKDSDSCLELRFSNHQILKNISYTADFIVSSGHFPTTNDQQPTTNDIIFSAANEIRQSAMFGEIIIMIVYVPLLLLSGIEGKMFKPMALTVIFALVGAFLLSLTYVPMMSALFLKKMTEHKPTFADRIMNKLKHIYTPIIEFSLRSRKKVVAIGVLLLVSSLILFSTMGGEFIPQLDEGDFVVEIHMEPGTALTQMVSMGKIVGGLLLKEFPNEIELTNGKMGTSEVPTDAMGIEEMDLVLKMHDRNKWKRCHTRADFEKECNDVLEKVPGIKTSIQQPIAMRFNELMTGAKTDVIVKILGIDLDTLGILGNKIVKAIHKVEGATDVAVVKAEGMPQLFVTYNREALSRYGMSIDQVGDILQTAVAGRKSGVIYEGNRRFDVVVRMESPEMQKIEDLGNLLVSNSQGLQIPLKALAEIKIENGPAVVNRQNNERCLNVNLNIRGRDVQSVVADVQNIIKEKIKLPSGYRVTYGGQFENLINAKQRLMIVVPAALALIFLLLYLTFNNLRESLLVFSAIPFAATGGILALFLRSMPFSISAGVGFIALFGVAVLNGLVLIGYFNQLEKEGMEDVKQRIITGVMTRFRPVIMTATVASLGFLPMALASGAGAEVQKPLATVVIGGLITATILTLVLLPALYSLIYTKKTSLGTPKSKTKTATVLLIIISSLSANAQQNTTINSEQQAIDLALAQHPILQKDKAIIERNRVLIATGKTIPSAEIYLEAPVSYTNVGIVQQFSLPQVYRQNGKVLEQKVKVSESEMAINEYEISYQVRQLYQNCLYTQEKSRYLAQQDSGFAQLSKIAQIESRVGKITPLEKMNMEAFYDNIHQEYTAAKLEHENSLLELGKFIGVQITATSEKFQKANLSPTLAQNNLVNMPIIQFYEQEKILKAEELKKQQLTKLPGINTELKQAVSQLYQLPSLKVGLLIPLWRGSLNAQIKASELETKIVDFELQNVQFNLTNARQKAKNDYTTAESRLNYFETKANKNAEEILIDANKTYKLGGITAFEYLQSIRQAFDIKMGYLNALRNYNMTIAKLSYFK
jgi:heavy metal efflux system protein